ncbi:serine-type peptidase [Aureococcus anophagefferens]|nr:serine-type peptidase [Aureococcus anophagefferens]
MAKDQPAGVAFLDSAMHAKAWACFMFFCSAYDIFLFVTYGGLCLYSGLLSMERCVPGLPLLTTDKHGNYEEVTHMLVKKTLEALHDKAHAGVVKERAAATDHGVAAVVRVVAQELAAVKPEPPAPCGTRELDGRALIGMTRVGGAVVSPDGTQAVLHSKVYDFDAKKFDETLWLVDVAETSGAALAAHAHLTPLVKGSQHSFASANSPQWSPCGKFVAFLSNRGKEGEKTSVWTVPVAGPGEATLLKRFPSPSATSRGRRTKAEGGLDAHVFKRLPVREWDRWVDAKFAHPFFQPVSFEGGAYVAKGAAVDGLAKVATACPSGAFGGSEDWSIAPNGAVALSCRPPLAADEAWTTNRHVYLKGLVRRRGRRVPHGGQPGLRLQPGLLSKDGSKLAWLTMAGAQYEADAIGIKLYDVATKATTDLVAADADFAYSPQSLHWSGDGSKIYFTADVRARRRLCVVDVASRAVEILGSAADGSISVHGEIAGGLLVSRDSFGAPPELYRCGVDGAGLEQLTFFNEAKLAAVDLGVAEDVSFFNPRPGRESPEGADIQAYLLKPANFDAKKKYPLAVVIHGGPQGSIGDDWHYRWNLQSYASAGFGVLAVNFRGSTGLGHAYCRDISGDWSIGPDDTVAGVRHVLETYDWIDPCLVNHDGVFDLRSAYWSTEELFFMEKEFGGTPYAPESQLPESPYQKVSPAAAVTNWKTPTLRQGVESELLFLPDENHHCLNPQNSLVWHHAVLSWIKKHTA